MAIITTSAMIGGIVTYLSTKLAKNESISEFVNDFTDGTVNWVKPLFIKDDGKLQKELEKLKSNPTSELKQKAVQTMLESELEDNPSLESHVKEIFEKVSKTEEGAKIVNNIINSENVNTGNIKAGGDVIIGNNNSKQ